MDLQQQWVQQEGAEGVKLHRVQHDGRLVVAAAGVLAPQNLQWVPCCVVDVSQVLHPSFPLLQQQQRQQQSQESEQEAGAAPAPQQQQQQQQLLQGRQGAQQPQPKSPVFLVGAWADMKVDPSVWGLGIAVGVLQFKPKVATQRLLQHHCGQHHREGWVPGIGMRPRLWRNRLGAEAVEDGLQEMEAALKRSFAEMQQGGAPGSTQGAHSSSQRFSDAALMAAYHAPWMDPPRERELPRQRAAAAAAVVTLQRQQQIQQQLQISSPAGPCDTAHGACGQ
jgi:hypothetical protein